MQSGLKGREDRKRNIQNSRPGYVGLGHWQWEMGLLGSVHGADTGNCGFGLVWDAGTSVVLMIMTNCRVP